MAVTKIWAIKDNIRRVVEYARNPEKTEYSDIQNLLHYAGNDEKTVIGEEKTMYVTGVNCGADTAFQEMISVQERFDKTTGNVAYHAYQSFKTGEVTPELCHRLGVELAQKMWGDRYQVLVATHFNTGTYHNHFVLNSVGIWDGKKFDCNEGAYWKFRSLSDELCKENGLTVIKNPKGKTPRTIYFAEKNGEPTKYNLMREAINKSLSMSTNEKTFCFVMRRLGYVVDLNPYHKYATIRSINGKKATRLYRLGEAFDRNGIYERMRENRQNWQEPYRLYDEFIGKKRNGITIQRKQYRVQGSFKTAKKITGLRALYLHYCYLLGVIPKNKRRTPLSPEMREACRWLDRYSEQVRLVGKYKLRDLPAVESFIEKNKSETKLLTDYRKIIRKELASCHDPDRAQELIAKRNACTAALAGLRKEIKTAERLIEDNPKIKENIRIEEQMRQEIYAPKKQRKREYER